MTALSDEALALLGMLHRAAKGGPPAPAGFEDSYAELESRGFVRGKVITSKGRLALREYLADISNPNLFPPRPERKGPERKAR